MNTARGYHTATLLSSGKVLVAGGLASGHYTYLSRTELYDPACGTWTTNGSLIIGRANHTATLLNSGKLLFVGGDNPEVGPELSSVELYDPVTGCSSTQPPMSTAREFHTATLLPNGTVLVAGGDGQSGVTNSAELYDPLTETWTSAGHMSGGRVEHTATLLPDGRVLVAGGFAGSGVQLSSAELYDPKSGTWMPTGAMTIARSSHTATLLANGKVMVCGGYNNGSLNSAELYDPDVGTWAPATPLGTARRGHSATLLAGGDLLVAGGYSVGGYVSSVELYDHTAGTWTAVGALEPARGSHTATLLYNGEVLFTGGWNQSLPSASLSTTELYVSANGTWSTTGSLTNARTHHTATLLPYGKVLVAGGGSPTNSAELYNPDGFWTNTGLMLVSRSMHTATLLGDGRVLVAGGYDGAGVAMAELYIPSEGRWTNAGTMVHGRLGHTATLLPNGKVLVAGGREFFRGNFLSSAELFDPFTRTWALTGSLTTNRQYHSATLLTDGRVLVAGGQYGSSTNFGTLANAELFDPATGMWTSTESMSYRRSHHTATLLPNGKVLVAGGADDVSTSSNSSAGMTLISAELYDPLTGTWTNTGSMNIARESHQATLLPNGQVLVEGMLGYATNAEVYDPASATWAATGSIMSPRFAHTATLLPNGKVLIAGGSYAGGGAYLSAELYEINAGVADTWKPQVTTITSPLNFGGSAVINGSQFRGISEASSSTSQDSPTDYPLVQLRCIESGQTRFLLSMSWSTNSIVSTPVWNFPPGWALATVFVNGIQSTSAIVNIGGPAPTPPLLTGAKKLNNGSFQFAFTSSVGASFGVFATTNLSLPLTNWTALGAATEISPGQFQFTDPQATNNPWRFYNVRVP
jgi:N-acetylneuraminic acid mutarotase